jgi:hypothetical protein
MTRYFWKGNVIQPIQSADGTFFYIGYVNEKGIPWPVFLDLPHCKTEERMQLRLDKFAALKGLKRVEEK